MTPAAPSYLDMYLAPFAALLARRDVTDVYVNRPGEIWAETLGGAIERHAVAELNERALWRLARQVASLTHQGISREHPLLSARLPDGARIQIVAPPATREHMAVAIRKHVSANLRLSDYDADGAFDATRSADAGDPGDADLRRLFEDGRWSAFLRLAVLRRRTIIVSGGTASGKTTFLNALLAEVPQQDRVVVIEDTPEVVLDHPNALGLVAVRGALGEARVTTDDLLTASLRLRPDRIILGELRGTEAFTFLRAINTGHPGSLTTIHADSCDRAISQLALLVMQAGTQLGWTDVVDYVGQLVDIVVQLDRAGGRRRIGAIAWRDAAEPAQRM